VKQIYDYGPAEALPDNATCCKHGRCG